MRIAPFEFGVALGPRHEECFGLVNDIQPGEVQIAPVQQVKRARRDSQIVQRIDLVLLAVGDVDETGNVAPQIQQGMQLDGSLDGAKRSPCKHRQTQVDQLKNNRSIRRFSA